MMTLCPVAVVAGCAKCPVFKICPLKSVIGDQPAAPPEPPPASKAGAAPPADGSRGRRKA